MAGNRKPSAKAIPWLLFAAGGTTAAFLLPVMVFVTGLGPLGVFEGAFTYETMSAFFANWIVKLIVFGILTLIMWHAAHRLRVCAHDFGIRADTPVAAVLYGLAAIGTVATVIALVQI